MVTNVVNKDRKKYISLADTTFKERHSNHKRDFKHLKYCNWMSSKLINLLKTFAST